MRDRAAEKVRRVGVLVALLALTGCGPQTVTPSSLPPDHPHSSHAARTTTSPAVTGTTRPCRAVDLGLRFRDGEGATGHYASLLDFRNVSRTACVLSGSPRRVTLTEPGHRPVVARPGGFFQAPLRHSRPMAPGGVTTVVIETDTYCPARPSGGPEGPIYHHVTVALASGALRTTTRHTRGLDVGCGAFATTFGRWN